MINTYQCIFTWGQTRLWHWLMPQTQGSFSMFCANSVKQPLWIESWQQDAILDSEWSPLSNAQQFLHYFSFEICIYNMSIEIYLYNWTVNSGAEWSMICPWMMMATSTHRGQWSETYMTKTSQVPRNQPNVKLRLRLGRIFWDTSRFNKMCKR